MTKTFLGLLTRCKDEKYINEFIHYYISQGVDKIYIIDDDSIDKSIYDTIQYPNVDIVYSKNITQNNFIQTFYYKIRNQLEWLIYIDVDEFITTRKNIHYTIRQELLTTFKQYHCICVPWVMMACQLRQTNPKCLLEENTYRWNHDLKHPHSCNKFRCRYDSIEVKSIFRPKYFSKIKDHFPIDTNSFLKYINSVNLKRHIPFSPYLDLREKSIKTAFLVCYHYRIISLEQIQHKLNTSEIYIREQITYDDYIKSDHADICDETLKHKSINERLKFVHITKTSGTYIEKLGLSKNLKWGMYDNHLLKGTIPLQLQSHSKWHVPLESFVKNPYPIFPRLFTIVRNPYTRIISECYCPYGGVYAKKWKLDLTNPIHLNKYISNSIDNYQSRNGHFVPQHLYTHSDGKQIIDHIFKYEEIVNINSFFKKEGLDIIYEVQPESKKPLTIEDITPENIEKINKVYHLDFEYFGYDTL